MENMTAGITYIFSIDTIFNTDTWDTCVTALLFLVSITKVVNVSSKPGHAVFYCFSHKMYMNSSNNE